MLESLITTLTGRGFGGMPGPGDGPGGGPGGGDDYGAVETMLRWENFNQFGEIKGGMTDSSLPQAYINYLMFDEQMQLVPEQSGAIQVTAACADNWSIIGTPAPINIKNNGQLLIYIDGVRTKDVFFDDLHVLHKKGRLLEENHYYPHGLTIRSGASNPQPTREGYQGKELQDEVGLNCMISMRGNMIRRSGVFGASIRWISFRVGIRGWGMIRRITLIQTECKLLEPDHLPEHLRNHL